MHCRLNRRKDMYNNLIIRYLIDTLIIEKRLSRVFLALFLSTKNRGVLPYRHKAFTRRKVLIANVLNSIFALEFAKENVYLCIAKVPYYGRFSS